MVSNKFLLAHHLGMGDHIVLNGLVRHIYQRESANGNEFWLLCYTKNYRNVKRMYEFDNINLLCIDRQDQIGSAINNFQGKVEDLHLWGKEKFTYPEYADEAFFLNFGYPVSLLQEFKITRALEAELQAKRKLDAEGEYIFVHDDPERNLIIDEKYLPKDVKIVKPGNEIPMFDLLKVMADAKECHFISSSFLCIALAYKGLIKNATAHLYVKNDFLAKHCNKYGIKTIV